MKRSCKTSNRSKGERFALCCGGILLSVSSILAIVALVCALGTVIVHQSTFISTEYKISDAKLRIAQLERMINESVHSLNTTTQQRKSDVKARIDDWNQTHSNISDFSENNFSRLSTQFEKNHEKLKGELDKVVNTVGNELKASLHVLNKTTETSGLRVEDIQNQITDFNASYTLSSLEDQIKAPAMFYKNCTTTTETCKLYAGGRYWEYCTTDSVDVLNVRTNNQNLMIMAMNCRYDPDFTKNYIIGAVLRKDSNDPPTLAWCECNVRKTKDSLIQGDYPYIPLTSGFTADCILEITLCPLTYVAS